MAMMEMQEPEFESKGLDDLKKMFQRSVDAQDTARIMARRDRDWYDNYDNTQWTDEEKNELKSRGQPVVTANYIRRKINFLLGFEQRSRSDPRAYPRNPNDDQAAQTVTEVLDYVDDNSLFDQTGSQCFFDLCWSGIEAAEVTFENDEIGAVRIDPEKFFYDPRSREKDFSDARYMGYSDWYDLDEAIELFPGKREEIEASCDEGDAPDEGHEDKPEIWSDRDRKRVRIVVVYYKIGASGWGYAYHTGAEVLEEGESRYLNEDGKPSCAIIAQSAYVTRSNERYGVIRDMITPQMEVNYRRSMSLFLLKNRRLWARGKDVFPSPNIAKREAAKADGLLIANGALGQDWGFIDSTAEIAGNLELMQDAKSILESQGPNAGLQGRGVEGQSGRAIIAQQQSGLTEENTLFDAHNAWKLRIYRAFWARAKQFWTNERYVRVTDEENAAQFTHVNKPIVQMDPMTGQQVVVGMENALAQMDVDIIIEAGPDSITLQHEQFEQIAGLIPNLVNLPPQYALMLIEASQLGGETKQKMREVLQQSAENPAAQMQAQMEMMKGQLEMAKGQAEIAETESKTGLNKAKTIETATDAAKTAAEASVPQFVSGQPGF